MKKNYASFEKFNFVIVKKEVKFRNLQISKVLNDDTSRFFSSSFQDYVNIFEVYIV